jgi:endonuclease/exonuclease/phosphatase family metal-dependent hydrolase
VELKICARQSFFTYSPTHHSQEVATMKNRFKPLTAIALAVALFVSAFALAGCSKNDSATVYPADAIHEEIGKKQVTVMTFNIWIGGSVVDFTQVIEAIKVSGADVVGLQESDGNAPRIAALLGWPYVNESLQIISKYPLIQPGDGFGLYTYVQIAPGQVFAMSNIHLPSDPYGPYQIMEGMELKEVLASEEETRMPTLNSFMPTWKRLLEEKIPLVITGDFNSPSHLDWIESTVGARPANKFPVVWPESKAITDLGMIDTYRTIFPDPKKVPGITWTLGYPYPRIAKDEAVDRIDFIFVPTGTSVKSSGIVGPTGGPDVTFGLTPYPSDHLAVVSSFEFTPVEPPAYVAVNKTRYEAGETINLAYHAPKGDEDVLAIVRAGDNPLTQAIISSPPQEAGYFGSISVGTQTLQVGHYEAALVSNSQVVQRTSFWVVAKGALPIVSTDKSTYSRGEAISATWTHAYARKFDWIGIFSLSEPGIYYTQLSFHYTQATVNGRVLITATDTAGPLPAGQYELRYFSDDSYVISAATRFSVGK